MSALDDIDEEWELPNHGGPCTKAGVPWAENVASAGASYVSTLVGGTASGSPGR